MFELQGKELRPEAKALSEGRMTRGLTEEERLNLRKQFYAALKTYLEAI
jgi:hypothetical protein